MHKNYTFVVVLLYSCVIALIVLFLHVCTWEGMIFSFIGESLYKVNSNLKKPLYDCPICMCIWWGPVLYCCCIVWSNWTAVSWQEVLLTCMGSGAVNAVLIYIISADKEIYKELKDE